MLRLRIAFLMVVALLAAAALACGSPKTATGPTQSPQAAASAPAATTTPGPTPPSPPQALAEASPVRIAPVASGATVRSDCPVGFVTWRDPNKMFSVCAPPWLEGRAGVDNVGAPTVNLLAPAGSPEPGLFLSVQVTPRGNFPDPSQVASRCASGLIPRQTSGEEVGMTVAGLGAVGCHVVGAAYATAGAAEELDLTAPKPGGGPLRYLNVIAIWSPGHAGARAIVDQMLATLTLAQ